MRDVLRNPLQLRYREGAAGLDADELERRFREEYWRKSKAQHRVSALLGLALFGGWGPLDVRIAGEEVSRVLWTLRYGVGCPAIFATFALSFFGFYPRIYQWFTSLVILVTGLAVVGMCLTLNGTPFESLYFAGIIPVLIYGYTFSTMRFAWATAAGLAVVVAYQLAALRLMAMPLPVLVNNDFLLLTGNFIGMFAAWTIERYARRDFVQRLQLVEAERQEAARLAQELALAKNIQDNFLSRLALPREAGLEIASLYVPATEVAGDWYGYFHDPACGDTLVAIADVSGHGAGSAMFTAIIACLFDEAREAGLARFDGAAFVARLNRRLYSLGQQKWHATLQLACFRRATGKLEIHNAGHPFPFLFDSRATGKKVSFVTAPSDVLGLSEEVALATREIELTPGTTLLLYTDGLYSGHSFIRLTRELNRMEQAGALPETAPLVELLERIDRHRAEKAGSSPVDDDVCLLMLRPVA